MTVANAPNYNTYTGDGSTVAFTVTYYFINTVDLSVTVNGVVKTLGLDYSVSGAGNPMGGTVTFGIAPANAQKVTITNAPAISQTADFVNFQTLLEDTIGLALDKLTIISQWLGLQVANSLKKDPTLNTPVWNGGGLELTNIADGTVGTSAATVEQLTSIVTASGNVPAPLIGDVGKFLKATAAGVYGWVSVTTGQALLAAANVFTGGLQTIQNTATSGAQSFMKLIGGDGTGIGALWKATCTATGISQWSEFLGAVETKRVVYNSGVPEIQYPAVVYVPNANLTDAATIAWNAATQQNATVVLGGNRILAAPTNMKPGAIYNLIIKQDATGSRTLDTTTAGVYKFPGGVHPTLSTAANAIDIISFISDGTNMYGSIAQAFA